MNKEEAEALLQEEYMPKPGKPGRPKLTEEEKRLRKQARDAEKRRIKEQVKYETKLALQKKAAKEALKTVDDESEDIKETSAKDDFSSQLANAVKLATMESFDSDNPDLIKQRIKEYFEYCQSTDDMPTFPGLALALGTDSRQLTQWLQKNEKGSEVTNIIIRAIDIITNLIEQLSIKGKIDKTFAKFTLMANFGYRDSADVSVAAKGLLDDTANLAKIAEKYSKSIVDDSNVDLLQTEIEPPKEESEQAETAEQAE